jgi:NAD(P)-dependent dehydrogenase (short-subunit alcohol dehydrogenase family)
MESRWPDQKSATNTLAPATDNHPRQHHSLLRGITHFRSQSHQQLPTSLSASLLGDRLEERRNELRATLPIGRVVGPADVAALAVHIMSNTALTGATYDIDGGQQFV